ncbi:hypothetical protein ACEPAG_3591 [Sanghuangporus baumii]
MLSMQTHLPHVEPKSTIVGRKLCQIEQRRQENEMNIDSFDDLGLLSGMDHNDILELLFVICVFSKYNKEEQRQCKKKQAENWAKVYPELVECYLFWSTYGAPVISDDDPRHEPINCLSLQDVMIGFRKISFPLDREKGLTITMLRHGYVANAPLHPELGISVELLKLFSAINGRCGNVGVNPFVRSICDYQQILFKSFYLTSFSNAFDVYAELLYRIDKKLDVVLQFDKKSKL